MCQAPDILTVLKIYLTPGRESGDRMSFWYFYLCRDSYILHRNSPTTPPTNLRITPKPEASNKKPERGTAMGCILAIPVFVTDRCESIPIVPNRYESSQIDINQLLNSIPINRSNR